MPQNTSETTRYKWLLTYVLPPVAIVLVAFIGLATVAKLLKPEPESKEPARLLPSVSVIEVSPESLKVEVDSQGTVQPRTQTALVAEVSGRVESVSPAIYAGSFFEEGDILITIDPTEYEANLAAALSRQAEARLAYEQEKAAAEQAREDWSQVGNGETPSPLVLREFQLQRAEANLKAAESAVTIAQRDLERTRVKAPYDGRVREKYVDVGQMVNARTSQLATIYSTDVAEIRLPISLDDARYIELPESFRDSRSAANKPEVIIEGSYAGQLFRWRGVIDRSEGAVDPQLRMLFVVAQVQDPYSKSDVEGKPPLKVGMFVTARIQGDTVPNAFALPRRALHPGELVYTIDEENRVRMKRVEVYKRDEERIIVTDGLAPGDRVSLTPLEYAVDGMEVIVDETVQSPTAALATTDSQR